MNWLNKLRGQNVKGFFVIKCVTSFCKKFIILYNKYFSYCNWFPCANTAHISNTMQPIPGCTDL